jgi:succinate dehydrogenase / fumarate reductase cytochrome b subunit
MKHYYFPGCTAKGVAKELDASFKLIAPKLGINFFEDNKWSCCGAGAIEDLDMNLSHDLNERNLRLAEIAKADLLTICNTCQVILKRASIERESAVGVRHLLEYLMDLGLEELKVKVAKPLSLKVAPFYGCHILRPGYILNFDNPENPRSLEKVIKALGCEPIDYVGRLGCCGFHILLSLENAALSMIGEYLKNAIDEGADCMVTPCPLCHTALDAYQNKAVSGKNIPILHLPQIIGLALGFSSEELGMERHIIEAVNIGKS